MKYKRVCVSLSLMTTLLYTLFNNEALKTAAIGEVSLSTGIWDLSSFRHSHGDSAAHNNYMHTNFELNQTL